MLTACDCMKLLT